jgi:hypothetical protein
MDACSTVHYSADMRAAILLVLCLPAFAPAQAHDRSDLQALQRQGYRLYEGRWRLPQEIVYLQRAAAQRAAPAVAVPPAKAPVAKAAAVAAKPDWLQRPRRATSTGVFSIRLQKVDLLGLDTVPVSFGTGQGRLQLPRTQSISIGTTVALPLR